MIGRRHQESIRISLHEASYALCVLASWTEATPGEDRRWFAEYHVCDPVDRRVAAMRFRHVGSTVETPLMRIEPRELVLDAAKGAAAAFASTLPRSNASLFGAPRRDLDEGSLAPSLIYYALASPGLTLSLIRSGCALLREAAKVAIDFANGMRSESSEPNGSWPA